MAENKRRRIARIGNMASVQGTANVHRDDGLAQADCNLVYDIMQSMNKSQLMSYQQLQEFKSKENCISTSFSEQNSSKQNGKPLIPKQIKKFVPEKTFPLMAKCQKSMKYLKKNRCIPKPRAHVGFIPRPPQTRLSNLKLNDMYNDHNASHRTSHNDASMKIKQSSKKNSHSLKMDSKLKKPNVSQSLDNSCDKNTFQTESSEKEPKLISNAETDSDDGFEQFIQEHHPANCTDSSDDYSSDSSIIRRKIRKTSKIKRKERKKIVCLAKMSRGKMTRKTLTESEESSESQVECDENSHRKAIGEDNFTNDSSNQQFHSSRFQRIVEFENSDDSVSDSYVNDSGTLNYDSFNSSEDEDSLLTKSSNKENVDHAIDLGDSKRFDILPTKSSSVASSSNSLSELKDTLYYDILKSKCKIPCYVVIKRDPLLDQKVASCTANSSVNNMVLVPNLCDDDDDCIIINETNFMSDNSENVKQPIVNRNSYQEKSTGVSKSPSVSELLTNINKVQNKNTNSENVIFNSTEPIPQTETNALLSNEKSTEKVCCDKDTSLKLQKKEVYEEAPSKFLSDTGNGNEKEEYFIVTKTRHSDENVISPEYEEKNTLDYEKSTSALENETFNVQILSVKSLNESDVIVLSDDCEERDVKNVPIVNETNETAADDSDVEIICLDSSVNNEKTENVMDISNSGIYNKVNDVSENSSSSSIPPMILNEEDCIILDVDIPSENTCTAKYGNKIGEVRQSSQVNVKAVDIINNKRTNLNSDERRIISDTTPNLDNNSILKILDTIDFNCIKKVLNETTSTDTWIDKNSDNASAKAESSLCENIQTSDRTADLFPENRKQIQNDACASEQRASIDVSIACVGSSEINKISSLKTSPANTCEEHIKLVQNSNVLHNIKDTSENLPSLVKSDNVPASIDRDKSLTFCNSSTNLSAPKSSVSEKEIIASSHKTELNTSLYSRKNQQMLHRYTKLKNNESASDVLDILAAKSIQNLDEKQKKTILPLVELYQAEYKKFIEIKSTEKNVTEGLKLLEENQARKLMHISSSIKNIAKNDICFHKVKNETINNKKEHKSCPVKTDESLDEMKKTSECVTPSSNSNWPDIKKDDKVRIFHPSVVEGASEILKSQSVGPSSSQEVYNHLINSVCAECGKNAMAACLGCAKVFYCSEKCGMSYWSKGHYSTCRR